MPDTLRAAFEETLCSRVEKLQTGNGMEDGVGVGPLVNDSAVAKVERQVEDARKSEPGVPMGEARLTEGDHANGHFFAPTVLTDVNDEMAIYREEPLGRSLLSLAMKTPSRSSNWQTTPITD